MRVHLLGVRGSTPTPGAEFARHGGNTSCVAVESAGRVGLVLDAGTGLRTLGALLEGAAYDGTLLLGHLHWDHTQGLPFSPSVDRPDARVHLVAPGPEVDGASATDPGCRCGDTGDAVRELLGRAMSPPHFPISPDQLRGTWTWAALDDGPVAVVGSDLVVRARRIPHKGGSTFGFRISDSDSSIAYLSDHMPQALGPGPDGWGEYHEAAMDLVDGVDVLIHDAQYRAEELPERGAFGHAAAEYAVELGRRASVGRVVLFHHDPWRTDDEVDATVSRFARSEVEVIAAVEGAVIDVTALRRTQRSAGTVAG